MSGINKDSAAALACARVNNLALSVGDQFEILHDQTQEVEQGWIFFYNTVDFIKTRDSLYALAGNGPILVTRDGAVQELPSAVPWTDSMKEVKDPNRRWGLD